MRPALLVALGLGLGGCLGEPTNPPCQSAENCPPGWCRCIDGLCFKFDCPDGPAADQPDVAGAGDAASDPACPAGTPAIDGDDCCPAGLADRSADADCEVGRGSLSVAGAVRGGLVVTAGRRIVVLAGSTLHVASPDLVQEASIPLDGPLSEISAPVALASENIAIATDTLLLIPAADPGAAALPWPGWPALAPASAPVARSDGGALVIGTGGALITLPPVGAPVETPGLLPAGRRWSLALSDDGQRLAAVGDDGSLHVLGLSKGVELYSGDLAAVGAPVFGPNGEVFAAVLIDGGGAVAGALSGASWIPLVPRPVGPAPTSPVITAAGEVVVASPAAKRVIAVRYPNDGGEEAWRVEQLGEAVVGAPAPDGPRVLLALASKTVVAIDPTRSPAAIAWQWAAPEAIAVAPVALGDGTAVVLTQAGTLVRLRTR